MARKEDTPAANGQAQQAPAANMPLFYQKPEPLEARKHATLALKKNFGFKFTEKANAVPVNLIEMPQICHYYPIAFSPDGHATPVAILGLRDHENLFVDNKGNWRANTYIPAYIRRYPFIFSEMPQSDKLSLCIDMNDDVVTESGDQPFFNAEGKASELSNNALEFCKSYHAAAQQTLAFSKALADSGLLVDREAQLNVAGNKRISFSGFRIINEEKLAALDEATIIDWHKKGWMAFIYAHLFSGSQWQNLTHLLNEQLSKDAA